MTRICSLIVDTSGMGKRSVGMVKLDFIREFDTILVGHQKENMKIILAKRSSCFHELLYRHFLIFLLI